MIHHRLTHIALLVGGAMLILASLAAGRSPAASAAPLAVITVTAEPPTPTPPPATAPPTPTQPPATATVVPPTTTAVPPTATTGRREESEDEGGSPAATPEPTATPAPPTAAPELPTATPADVPTGGRAAVPPARLPNTGMDDGSAPALLALGVALILLGLTFARWRRREGAEEKSVSRW